MSEDTPELFCEDSFYIVDISLFYLSHLQFIYDNIEIDLLYLTYAFFKLRVQNSPIVVRIAC